MTNEYPTLGEEIVLGHSINKEVFNMLKITDEDIFENVLKNKCEDKKNIYYVSLNNFMYGFLKKKNNLNRICDFFGKNNVEYVSSNNNDKIIRITIDDDYYLKLMKRKVEIEKDKIFMCLEKEKTPAIKRKRI